VEVQIHVFLVTTQDGTDW